MTVTPLDVLAELNVDRVPTPEDVWLPSSFHVEKLHSDAAAVIQRCLVKVARERSPQMGIVVEGQRGVGKTHLLGWVREKIQQQDGYFFLVTLHDGVDFWTSALHCVINGLTRSGHRSENQLRIFLRCLAAVVDMPTQIQDAVAGELSVPPSALNIFVDAFRAKWPDLGAECHETLRALVLRASKNVEAIDVGLAYLQGREETETGERRHWGIRHKEAKNPQWIIAELLRLLALTGPTVIAVDQIDDLVVRYGVGSTHALGANALAQDDRQLNLIAGGLMGLREQAPRTLCILSCLPRTWALIRNCAVDTAADRFRHVLTLERIPSSEIAEELVAKRFAPVFQALKFVPPYSTWPIKQAALADVPHEYTTRLFLTRIDEHITACLNRGVVTELGSLGEVDEPREPEHDEEPEPPEQYLRELDERFHELLAQADVSAALDAATEDEQMPLLLAAGLRCWIDEQGAAGKEYSFDPPTPGKNSLHGLLRRTLNEELEEQTHWAFRGIASTNARAALTRLRDASGFSGLRAGGISRKLIILRRGDWSDGQKTKEALDLLDSSGGMTIRIDPADLAVFDALRRLREHQHTTLNAWLLHRKPASGTKLLAEALSDIRSPGDPEVPLTASGGGPGQDKGPQSPDAGKPKARRRATDKPKVPPSHDISAPITIGTALDTDQKVHIEVEALRKHVAIFAGSGSGKTVLIRRLVEECALRGVSSIVLDPGNDLARLGDPWPSIPAAWGDGDEARATDYLVNTEVTVWTPQQPAGRPLTFQPLPDFSAIQSDEYEVQQAVDAAVATLASRARMAGDTAKAVHGRAILHETMTYFAHKGHSGLRSYVALLRDLPDGVTALPDAQKVAAEMARTLESAMVLDRLFGGAGTPVDPGILLTPPPGKRARVSVISFIGLTGEEQQQSFVNQLQLGLFTWLKKHPASDRPLGGLLVMDEAQMLAPSDKMTVCTRSTIMLVTQARKYGLGLVFGTQAPKGLHNHIPSNAATQLFGRLGAGAPVDAAREIAQGKGSAARDFASLDAGTFYISAETTGFTKVHTPMCLTHHARSALTPEEVTARARAKT